MNRFLINTVSIIAMGFGLLTLKEGGAVLFGGGAARSAAGDYVPFVLWFNFLAGFAYVIVSLGHPSLDHHLRMKAQRLGPRSI